MVVTNSCGEMHKKSLPDVSIYCFMLEPPEFGVNILLTFQLLGCDDIKLSLRVKWGNFKKGLQG